MSEINEQGLSRMGELIMANMDLFSKLNDAYEVIRFYENVSRLMLEVRDLPTEDSFGMPMAYDSKSIMDNGDTARAFLKKHGGL